VFEALSPTKLKVGPIDDGTDLGEQALYINAATGAISPLFATVIHLVINELDSDQNSTDTTEFVELATGVAGVSLGDYVLVFFNGRGDVSYVTIALAAETDDNGLLLVANPLVPGAAITFAQNTLQNGQDAVAVYQAKASDFTVGTAATSKGIIDALVYDTSVGDDPELLQALMGPGPHSIQVDENGTGAGISVSIQRCSDERLDGRAFNVAAPTAGSLNSVGCP